jgi:hypothetical protein
MGYTPLYGGPSPRIPPYIVSECQFRGDNPRYYAKKFLGKKWTISPPVIDGFFYFIEHDPPFLKSSLLNEKNFWKNFIIICLFMFMENKSINEEVSRIIEIMGGNDENSLEKEVEIMKANRKFKTEMDLLNSVISRLSDSTQKQDWSIVEDVIKDLIKYQEVSELEDEWISSWNLRVPQLPWER